VDVQLYLESEVDRRTEHSFFLMMLRHHTMIVVCGMIYSNLSRTTEIAKPQGDGIG